MAGPSLDLPTQKRPDRHRGSVAFGKLLLDPFDATAFPLFLSEESPFLADAHVPFVRYLPELIGVLD